MFKRGDVVWVNLISTDATSRQNGSRPAILVNNNKCLEYSPVVHIVPLTSKSKKMLPTHVEINKSEYPIKMDSMAMCEQITLISKEQIISEKAEFTLNNITMIKINIAIIIQFEIGRAHV